jgi:hypothetical protein
MLYISRHGNQYNERLFWEKYYVEFPFELFVGPNAIQFDLNTSLSIVEWSRTQKITLEDLTFLSDHYTIIGLYIGGSIIVNTVDGIEGLFNLRYLEISHFAGANLNGLEFCNNLDELVIVSENNFGLDISQLHSHSIKELGIYCEHLNPSSVNLINSQLIEIRTRSSILSKMVGKFSAQKLLRLRIFIDDEDIKNYIHRNDEGEVGHILEEYSPIKWLIEQKGLQIPFIGVYHSSIEIRW